MTVLCDDGMVEPSAEMRFEVSLEEILANGCSLSPDDYRAKVAL